MMRRLNAARVHPGEAKSTAPLGDQKAECDDLQLIDVPLSPELRHMQSDLSAIAGTLAGHVTIGALPLGRTLLLPDGIATAVKRHPNLRISTVESPYEALVHGLRNGDIDFILGALRSDGHGEGLIVE
ncbi:MAG: hypothetical protein EBW55_09245, partial [Betaproteobacteria bacterium]|nr:hypothetical protein [Betaproteobacteria bacterium]